MSFKVQVGPQQIETLRFLQNAVDAGYAEAVIAADAGRLEPRLSRRKFLFGNAITETDIRVFVTLVRFDAAYHGVFKCNLRRIVEYPALSAFLRRMMAVPGVRETVNIDHIKRGYYSIKALNPTRIVPLGPELAWLPQ